MEVIMKKGTIYIVMLVGVLAILYFAFIFPWPQNENVQGTIGGVKKYNQQQLSEKDVKLEAQQYSEAEIAEIEKRVDGMEGRLAVEGQKALLSARGNFLVERLAPLQAETKQAPLSMEAQMMRVEAKLMERTVVSQFEI